MDSKTRIQWRPVDDVHPYQNNPRHNDDAVEYVANSIREFGWQQPIVVDTDGTIIAGHTRHKAAKMYLNGELKKDVCESLGISMPTLNRRLKNLCDKEILRRVGTGTYQLNPYILAMGNWAEITELRATFDYVNGTVTTEMKCIDGDTNETVQVM